MALSFLVDEHVPSEIVEGLRRRGIQVTTLNEVTLLSAHDIEILKHATANSLTLYTRDADFLRLHSEGIEHCGIIYHHPLSYSIGEAIRRLVLANEILTINEIKNQIRFL